jgi:hypothetical protein
VGAGNNQQNAAGSTGSGRDSGHGSGDRCSAGAMAGRGGGVAEAMVQDDRERDDRERRLVC